MNGALSAMIGALIVGGVTLSATVVYALTEASRVEQDYQPYADHDSMIDHE